MKTRDCDGKCDIGLLSLHVNRVIKMRKYITAAQSQPKNSVLLACRCFRISPNNILHIKSRGNKTDMSYNSFYYPRPYNFFCNDTKWCLRQLRWKWISKKTTVTIWRFRRLCVVGNQNDIGNFKASGYWYYVLCPSTVDNLF